jgi:hypothetical protein
MMSVVRGRPEVTGTQPTDAIDPIRTSPAIVDPITEGASSIVSPRTTADKLEQA